MYCPSCGVSNPIGAPTCRVCGKPLASTPSLITCPFCGADGQEAQSNCKKCGAELFRREEGQPVQASTGEVVEPGAPTPVESEPETTVATETEEASELQISSETEFCPGCGRPKKKYEPLCEYCKASEEESSRKEEVEISYGSEYDLPKVAGLLIMIAGILGIAHGMMTFASVTNADLPFTASCFTSLMVVFGVVAILGGASAMGRQNAVYATLGGIFGLLSIGFYVGAFLSLVGIALIARSYDEFKTRELSLDLDFLK